MVEPRASAGAVKGIIDTDLSTVGVVPFLNTAALLVSEHLGDAGLSDEILTEIELWLAAHLVAVRDPRAANKVLDDVSIAYEGRSRVGSVDAAGLQTTSYGKQVLLLDPTGRLARLSEPKRRPFRFKAGSPDSAVSWDAP